ncbi:MAG: iron ABC transporter permease [Desulfobacterales bacterium C00003060]|nr:MAG: iron ABC transporter permease [Desulfobacterales bacterium S3730MH5]OEU80329.1 MAG: iron ABC transporter permease [Desulfobacterales bacterium C00003060]OEU84000.1 MAG: iron ABC transporter permease [Desulfobacterales bacterium S5133MH4]
MKNGNRFGLSVGAQTFLLAVVLCTVIVASTGMGYIKISPIEVLRIIASKVCGHERLLDGINHIFPYVVVDVRLPRILTAAIVGGGLSIAGTIFQGILLNPLADPYTLGISAGAAFGASIALLLNVGFLGIYAVPFFAFVGAVATLFVVLYLSSFNGQVSSNNLILSGIIVAAILSAGISFIKYVADEQVSVIIFWLMGSFGSKTWVDVFLTSLFVLIGFFVFVFFARDLNIMSTGNRSAASLGVETNRIRVILLVTASLITAVCVSVSGIIGFVGLIVPHLMRFLVGPDNRKLLPASALAGATLLLCADTITRAVLPTEIPIGVLTALIGGPFFCYIFRQRQIARMMG